MEYSQPLGWITRTPEGKFVVEEGFSHPEPMHSNRASLQGSYRSEGSGQSGLGSMLDLSLRNRSRSWWLGHDRSRPSSYWSDYRPQIQTIYEPRSPRYRVRTSSPGPIAHLRPPLQIEDVSSVHQPSSVERSFPSTVSSRFTPSGSGIHSPSYELPSLRILHEQLPYIQEEYEPYEHYVRPRPVSQQVSAEIHHDPSVGHFQSPPRPMPVSQGYMHYPLQQHQKHYIMPIQEMGVLENGQHIHTSPIVHGPEDYGTRYYQPSGMFLRHRPRVGPSPRRQLDGYEVGGPVQPSLIGMGHQRPLATSSPPQTDRRVARVLPSAAGYSKQQGSESSSDDRPVTYTRDRLQEAIGRVRSGALRVEQPFRHSAPELVRGPVAYSPATTSTTEEEQVPVSLATEPTLTAPNCRTSVTSASSGRGSKHSRGDSLQGDLEYSPSSSSGFASRNTSQSQPSPHAVGVPAPAARPVARHPTPPHHDMPHLRTQLDISVDENYEFDSINPLETDLLNKMHQRTPPWVSDRGMSDSELYTNFYPRPKKTSKYDDIEIERRIPALKEEFHQFRRRQQERRRSEELESEC